MVTNKTYRNPCKQQPINGRWIIETEITTCFDWLSSKQKQMRKIVITRSESGRKKVISSCHQTFLIEFSMEMKWKYSSNEITSQWIRNQILPLIFPQFLAYNRITIPDAVLRKNCRLQAPLGLTFPFIPLSSSTPRTASHCCFIVI